MIYIGIDPGVSTGLAVWDSASKKFLKVETCTCAHAILTIYELWKESSNKDFNIVFEDARKRRWIPQEGSMSKFKGRAMGAGSVKRSSQIWEEFCEETGIKMEAVPPRPGMTKWEAGYWAKVTGWKGRTSEHARDAALLVFGR